MVIMKNRKNRKKMMVVVVVIFERWKGEEESMDGKR